MTIDLDTLWDFGDPAASRARLEAARATATGDDALILATQVARTRGLERNFDEARAVLRSIESSIAGAGAEARARWHLELGRTRASAAHRADEIASEDRDEARRCFGAATAIARAARLDGLAIDAIHMQAFVDDTPEAQLRCGLDALAIVESSAQPAATRWHPSIRNNIGMALHALGRLDEALTEFERALAVRERSGDAGRTRIARWMVAWTLRGLGRFDEALAIQRRLERELDAAGETDPHVFAELVALHEALGDRAGAARYAARRGPPAAT